MSAESTGSTEPAIIESHRVTRIEGLERGGFSNTLFQDGMRRFSKKYRNPDGDVVCKDVWISTDNHTYFERQRTRGSDRQPYTIAVLLQMFSSLSAQKGDSIFYPEARIFHRYQQADFLPNPDSSLDIGLVFKDFEPAIAEIVYNTAGKFDYAEILTAQDVAGFPILYNDRSIGPTYSIISLGDEGAFVKPSLFVNHKMYQGEVEKPLQLGVAEDLGGSQSVKVDKANGTIRIRARSVSAEVEPDLDLEIPESVPPDFIAGLTSPDDLKPEQILESFQFRMSLPRLGLEIGNKT